MSMLASGQAVKGRIDGHEECEWTWPVQGCNQPGHRCESVDVPGACSFGSCVSKDVCHLTIHFLSGWLEFNSSLLEVREEKRGKKREKLRGGPHET
jgi:hypothetical protein